jgi:argininosuccinate lyase
MSNQPNPSKMWSGRFREPLDPTFEQWQRSFPFDWQLYEAEISASGAHARTIAAAGILAPTEEEAILAGLREISTQRAGHIDGIEIATSDSAVQLSTAQQAEDVHHFIELELTRIIGPLALKLHTGRSRNEQIATDMRIYVLDSIEMVSRMLKGWMQALIEQAEAAGEAAMPSYTHLQRAEPVLVAHWLLAYVSMIERDYARLLDCGKRTNVCPLGSGAVAGATLPLDRSIAARFLYMDGLTSNSMDATSDRDFLLEFANTISILGIHISRFAEELTLFATAEFGFVDLPEAFSTGSSAMPQKKNPDLTELARGKAARLIGAANALATLMKGLPLAYNKDLQEGQEQTFDVVDTILGLLRVLPGFTSKLQFRFDKMKTAAESGYLNAMAAATYLTHKGVPFRKAHEKIGNAVRFALETGRELNDLTLTELRQFGPEFGEDFYESITLEATLDCHDVIGGTARHRVQQALAEARQRLESDARKDEATSHVGV